MAATGPLSKYSPAGIIHDKKKLSISTSPLEPQEPSRTQSACHIPQVHGSFQYTINDWQLIPHSPGEATLSPPFTIHPQRTQCDQWVLEVFPEGKHIHECGNVIFSLCNVSKSPVRASCRLKVLGGLEGQNVIRETEPAKPFTHNSEWDVDTGLTFDTMCRPDSGWLQEDGSLLVVVEVTLCGKPEVLHGEGLADMLTMLAPAVEDTPVPYLVDDLVKLLDPNSAIVELESGQTTIISYGGNDANGLDLLWKSDITLAAEDERIPCHQCILAARSPVFREMFQSSGTAMKMFLQAGKLYVTKHVHPSVLKAFVYYLYSDHCDESFLLEQDGVHLCRLLRTASKYQVKGLIALCSQFLITTLSVNNAAERLVLAHACEGTEKLQAATLHFIALHSAAITETEGFKQLDAELYRLVVAEMTTSPYSALASRHAADEGIEREASREGGVEESEQMATPHVVVDDEKEDVVVLDNDSDDNNNLSGDVRDVFNTPPSGSPAIDVKCKTPYQMLPEVDPQHHFKHKKKSGEEVSDERI